MVKFNDPVTRAALLSNDSLDPAIKAVALASDYVAYSPGMNNPDTPQFYWTATSGSALPANVAPAAATTTAAITAVAPTPQQQQQQQQATTAATTSTGTTGTDTGAVLAQQYSTQSNTPTDDLLTGKTQTVWLIAAAVGALFLLGRGN
jgi:hypothetical protein